MSGSHLRENPPTWQEKEVLLITRCRRSLVSTAFAIAAFAAAGALHAQSSGAPLEADPDVYGVGNNNWTTVAALSFSGTSYIPVAPLSRAGVHNTVQHFYATVNIPSNVVIDSIGLNNYNDGTPGIMNVTLYRRTILGATVNLLSVDSTPHSSWVTDSNPTSAGIPTDPQLLMFDVTIGSSPNDQYFGYAEVRWHRVVSAAPGTPSFADVPTTHPYFQFIEALKASGITGGCGNGVNYCPDNPVTRGQMAVFLAKALGL